MNHEGIIVDVGWSTVLSRANSKLPDLQRPAVTLIANLSMNGTVCRIVVVVVVFELTPTR